MAPSSRVGQIRLGGVCPTVEVTPWEIRRLAFDVAANADPPSSQKQTKLQLVATWWGGTEATPMGRSKLGRLKFKRVAKGRSCELESQCVRKSQAVKARLTTRCLLKTGSFFARDRSSMGPSAHR